MIPWLIPRIRLRLLTLQLVRGEVHTGTCVLLEHGHERQVGSLAYRNDWLAGYMISPTEREREKREKLAAVRAEEVPKYSTTTATTT